MYRAQIDPSITEEVAKEVKRTRYVQQNYCSDIQIDPSFKEEEVAKEVKQDRSVQALTRICIDNQTKHKKNRSQ